jgi:cytochrome c biogenesis protein
MSGAATDAPELSRREFARWMWRQVTSMRSALLLLLLLALVAIPGSVLPPASVDARAVEAYRLAHPELAPWLDRLGLFHTYTSVWFSAVYLLLMVSLVGCIVPRTIAYAKAYAARPPNAPANFSRMPASCQLSPYSAPPRRHAEAYTPPSSIHAKMPGEKPGLIGMLKPP